MTRVVLATRNLGKVRELQAMLEGKDVEVVGLDQFPQIGEIEETGTTFEENARIKAKAVSEATGLIALADDSGLAVDALDGAPGVLSARYSGDNATDASNNEKLLEQMKDVPADKRGCKFISCIVAHAPDGYELVFHGVWFGRLANEPKGENGFGYDPLFLDPELKLTAAEMSPEQKNERSHRGRAMRELTKYLPGFLETVAREAAFSPEEREIRARLTGVKGLLKVLCMVMLILVPVVAAFTVSQNLTFIKALNAPGGPPAEIVAEVAKALMLKIVLASVLGVSIFIAGLRLYRRRKGAVLLAKIAWLAVPVASAVQYVVAQFLAYPPDILKMAETEITANALPGLMAASACVTYLTFSRRVKITYE
ncbi:MAG: XTP/dITP diphosphatase [Desulfovibrio sp.]|nr:XTP/dITP diphosphatase [Desulfovibrio sp.]MBI4959805.1 XTP/dITP diphosphatase [Desulfovibrio sp.]